MFTTLEEKLEEIKHFTDNKDLNSATRRLMDFAQDYSSDESLIAKAIENRKVYNMLRELGGGELEGEKQQEVYLKSKELIDEIDLQKAQEIHAHYSQQLKNDSSSTFKDVQKYFDNNAGFHLGPISLNLVPGEITGIVGENGNGKTTLLRIIAGGLAHNDGEINYNIEGVHNDDWYNIKQQIAFIPQRIPKWYGTLRENLKFNAAIHGIKGTENDKRCDFIIHRLGLSQFAHLKWKELSSGYKLRFELAKMLVWNPKILVLDEPLANLDINAQQHLLQDIKQIASSIKNPVSVILSSQQLHEIETISDNIIFLRNGNCEYSGEVKKFAEERTENSFEISGDFSFKELQPLLSKIEGSKIEDNGTSFTVHIPLTMDQNTFLRTILDMGITLHYYRDISRSTRKLFKK